MAAAHIHPRALSALLALSGEDKSEVARRASMSPGHLRDLETFRNRGLSLEVRTRLAMAFRARDVTPASLSCWCDRPGGSCRAMAEEDET